MTGAARLTEVLTQTRGSRPMTGTARLTETGRLVANLRLVLAAADVGTVVSEVEVATPCNVTNVTDEERERNVLFNDTTQHIISSYMEREREMFYLTTQLNTLYLQLYGERERNVLFNDTTQHIISTVIWRERERNVLFNDTTQHIISSYMEREREMFYLTTQLNTLYLQLYGERERNVLFNDTTQHIISTVIWREREREKCFI